MSIAFKIIRILLGSCGIIIFLWFFLPGLITNHFHIGVVTGIIISLLLVVYAVFAPVINRFACFLWSKVAGKIIMLLIAAAVAAIIVLAVMCMISMGRGMRKNAGADATVVVLGCRVYSYGPSLMLKARLDKALERLEENPEAVCIVCGGQGSNEPMTEAAAMFEYLTGWGISPSRIYVDDTSKDTMENLENALQIIKENDLNPECTIVTSNYHCYRAEKYASQIGFASPGTVPADTLWWIFPSAYIREMYGILEMWFLR